MQQLVELERLGDEVGGAAPDGVDRVLHRAVSGDDDGDDVGVAAERRLDDARPVDARQAQVGDDDVEGEFGEFVERLLAGVGLHDVETVVGQAFRHGFAQRRPRPRRAEDVLMIQPFSGRQNFDTGRWPLFTSRHLIGLLSSLVRRLTPIPLASGGSTVGP